MAATPRRAAGVAGILSATGHDIPDFARRALVAALVPGVESLTVNESLDMSEKTEHASVPSQLSNLDITKKDAPLHEFSELIDRWILYSTEKLVPLVGPKPEGSIFSRHLTNTYDRDMLPKQINFANFFSTHKVLKVLKPGIEHKVLKVLEIGFNTGYSALLMKMSNPQMKLTCVDLNEHPYVVPCHKRIQTDYPDVKLITYSSRSILPILIHKGLQFDVIHIDGDHRLKGAQMDFDDSLQLCSTGGIIIMDDTDLKHIDHMCNKYVGRKLVADYHFKGEQLGQKFRHRFLKVL